MNAWLHAHDWIILVGMGVSIPVYFRAQIRLIAKQDQQREDQS